MAFTIPYSVVPYAPQQIYTPNGRLVDLIRAQGQDAARAAEQRGQQQAQLWSGVGNAIQGGVNSVLQATDPKRQLERQQVEKAKQANADTAATDAAFADRPAPLAPGEQGPTQPVAPTQDQILASLPGHLRPVVKRQFDEDAVRTSQVAKAQEELATANASKLSGLALSVREHDYDPAALKLALQSATQTYQNDPAMAGQIQRVAGMAGDNPSPDVVRRIVDSLPLTPADQKRWEEQVGKTRKGVSDAGLAALDHLQSEGGNPLSARDILTNRIAQSVSDGSIMPGAGNAALRAAASAGPDQLHQLLDQFVSPEDKATWQKNRAVTAKDLADANKANAEAAAGKTKTLEEQYLSALASGDKTSAATIAQTWKDKAAASRDPVASAQLEAMRNMSQEAARARLDDMNALSDKNQQKFEQQYRTVLTRAISSRAGGIGAEDAKVQQANHLMSLFEQTYNPKTGGYDIPRVQLNELALGLAKLTAGQGAAGEGMLKEFQQRTAKGDLAGALTYLSGEPIAANTAAITTFLKDSIERQGKTAEQNREGEMAYLRGLAPTDLNEDRRQKLEATSLNPLRQSRVAVDAKGNKKMFVSTDGGKTWK